MASGMKSLDYDRVVRNAVTIQSDPDVTKVLNAELIAVEDCWIPEDACACHAAAPAHVCWLPNAVLAISQVDANVCPHVRVRLCLRACVATRRDHRHVLCVHLDGGAAHCALVSGT